MPRPTCVAISVPVADRMVVMARNVVLLNIACHIHLLQSHAHVVCENVAEVRLFKQKIVPENSHLRLNLLQIVARKMPALLDCFGKTDRPNRVIDEHK